LKINRRIKLSVTLLPFQQKIDKLRKLT